MGKLRNAGWIPAAVVVFLTFLAFSPALDGEFLRWDDSKNFVANPDYRGLGAEQLKWMWTEAQRHGHYIPLTWMTLGLDYVLWGMDARGYHLTNLVLHCTSAALLYFVLLRLLRAGAPSRDVAALRLPAAAGALLYAVHPLRVESVAWVTERRDVLSLAFMLASTLCYLRWVGDRRVPTYVAAIALFAAALLSKAAVVMLPVAWLVLGIYPLRLIRPRVLGDWVRQCVVLAPFFVLSLVGGIISVIVVLKPAQLPLIQKLAVALYSAGFYIEKSFLPTGLSPLYALPAVIDPFAPRFLIAYAVAAIALSVVLVAYRRWPGVAAALICFVVLLLPLLGAVQNGPHIAADRNTYHAGVALSVLAALALIRWPRPLASLLVGSVLLTLGVLTWRQTTFWRTSDRVFLRVLALDSTAVVAQVAMGDIRMSQGRTAEAIDHYRRAVAIDSTYAEGFNNIGVLLASQRRYFEAIPEYQRAIRLRPDYAEAHLNLANALSESGAPASAVEVYARATSLNPRLPTAHLAWGNALIRLGKPRDAIPHFESELRLNPRSAASHLGWGIALADQGQFADAEPHLARAVSLDPSVANGASYLDRVRQLIGRGK